MHYHPILTAAFVQTRTADLHDTAAHAREARATRKRRRRLRIADVIARTDRLDAYPRLCGLPVSIERLPLNARTPK